jgi:hypothetical protein
MRKQVATRWGMRPQMQDAFLFLFFFPVVLGVTPCDRQRGAGGGRRAKSGKQKTHGEDGANPQRNRRGSTAKELGKGGEGGGQRDNGGATRREGKGRSKRGGKRGGGT